MVWNKAKILHDSERLDSESRRYGKHSRGKGKLSWKMLIRWKTFAVALLVDLQVNRPGHNVRGKRFAVEENFPPHDERLRISVWETIYSPTLMSAHDIIYFICACKFIKRALESLYFVLFELGSVFTIPLG